MGVFVLFWTAFFLCCHTGQAHIVCSSEQISCRSGIQCIDSSHVCSSGDQCSDSSDEDPTICSFWIYDRRHPHYCNEGTFQCSSYGCLKPSEFCRSPSCSSEVDSRVCELVRYGKLELKSEESGMALTEELVNLLKKVVNTTATNPATHHCPMFYSRVGDKCLSFFSPAKIPWAEARQFCLSIMGDLLSVNDLATYEYLLQYMRKSRLTTDYWIGGRYDLDTNAWSWVNDDTPMPLGPPYWAVRYSSSCVPRSPPHTDPFSSPAKAVPGAPCYNYIQAPSQRTQGWCAAMTYEQYFYFSDEECQDNRSPLCFFLGEHYNMVQKNSGNTTQ